jgi:hypothetical protein
MTLLLAAILLHLGFANTGATAYYPSTTKTTMVTVRASDFKFALSKTTVPHGRVTFVIKNTGHTPPTSRSRATRRAGSRRASRRG